MSHLTPAGMAGRTLVIQIPCHNEEEILPRVLADLPTQVAGIERIIALVIDDGSTDRTVEIARAHGAEVVRLPVQRGLARAFLTGLDRAVQLGADVVTVQGGEGGGRVGEMPPPKMGG